MNYTFDDGFTRFPLGKLRLLLFELSPSSFVRTWLLEVVAKLWGATCWPRHRVFQKELCSNVTVASVMKTLTLKGVQTIPDSSPGRVMWCTNWQWGRFSKSTSVSPAKHSTDCSTLRHHPPSGAGAIGQTAADVPNGLSLTPPEETEEKSGHESEIRP
jgi:hypothetical protein